MNEHEKQKPQTGETTKETWTPPHNLGDLVRKAQAALNDLREGAQFALDEFNKLEDGHRAGKSWAASDADLAKRAEFIIRTMGMATARGVLNRLGRVQEQFGLHDPELTALAEQCAAAETDANLLLIREGALAPRLVPGAAAPRWEALLRATPEAMQRILENGLFLRADTLRNTIGTAEARTLAERCHALATEWHDAIADEDLTFDSEADGREDDEDEDDAD